AGIGLARARRRRKADVHLVRREGEIESAVERHAPDGAVRKLGAIENIGVADAKEKGADPEVESVETVRRHGRELEGVGDVVLVASLEAVKTRAQGEVAAEGRILLGRIADQDFEAVVGTENAEAKG